MRTRYGWANPNGMPTAPKNRGRGAKAEGTTTGRVTKRTRAPVTRRTLKHRAATPEISEEDSEAETQPISESSDAKVGTDVDAVKSEITSASDNESDRDNKKNVKRVTKQPKQEAVKNED